MEGVPRETVEQFVDATHRLAAYGVVQCSSGNMSWRVGDDLMAVTGTGAWLERIEETQIALCRISDGATVNGARPSVESGFHAGVLRERPDIGVVLHCQSPCATAIACSRPDEINLAVIPEVPFYIGEPAIVPLLQPGSAELAAAVIEAAREHELLLLRNHGQVVLGRDFDDALQRAGFFELACEVLLRGRDLQPLPAEFAAALRAWMASGTRRA